jgi:hypothetical protein
MRNSLLMQKNFAYGFPWTHVVSGAGGVS